MNTVNCPYCGNENKSTNIKCEVCGLELITTDNPNKDHIQLDDKSIRLYKKYVLIGILIITLAPVFFFGLILMAIGTYCSIDEDKSTQGYVETEGNFIDTSVSKRKDALYTPIYEYKVNGTSYKASPNLLTNSKDFKQVITIKYNPSNPSEYVISDNWKNLFIKGAIIDTVLLIVFVVVVKKLTNESKEENPVIKM